MVSAKALITGASSGIGKAFAQRFASDGYDLVITARRDDLLKSFAKELREQFKIDVDVLVADLSKETGVHVVENYINQHEDISVLVNNAGFGLGGLFSDLDIISLTNMIVVHNVAAVRFSRAVVMQMKKNKTGIIINVASTAGLIPVPGSAVYAATKAFLISFSCVLEKELKFYGIKVQALCPGFTYSEFHDTPAFANFKRTSLPSFLWMRANKVVEKSLAALKRNKVIYIPGILNKFLIAFVNMPLFSSFIDKEMLKRKGLKK